MAQVTKTALTDAELKTLLESEFFMLKHSATEKVMQLFSETERMLKEYISTKPFVKDHAQVSTGKVFRGENYLKLPYVVLDYPKHFSADSIFAYRIMFWWGNEFSFTLHLYGHALEHYRERLRRRIKTLAHKDFYFCIGAGQWNYHFGEDNYRLLDMLLKDEQRLDELLRTKDFLKLSRRLSINKYVSLGDYALDTLQALISMIEE